MPAQRIKVEFYDEGGTKHTLCVEGSLTKDKVLKVLDYVELMGRLPQGPPRPIHQQTKTKFDRIQELATLMGNSPFKSQDIRRKYQECYDEDIPLSTISTYLCRLVDRSVLERSTSSDGWTYVVKAPGTLSWNNILGK